MNNVNINPLGSFNTISDDIDEKSGKILLEFDKNQIEMIQKCDESKYYKSISDFVYNLTIKHLQTNCSPQEK